MAIFWRRCTYGCDGHVSKNLWLYSIFYQPYIIKYVIIQRCVWECFWNSILATPKGNLSRPIHSRRHSWPILSAPPEILTNTTHYFKHSCLTLSTTTVIIICTCLRYFLTSISYITKYKQLSHLNHNDLDQVVTEHCLSLSGWASYLIMYSHNQVKNSCSRDFVVRSCGSCGIQIRMHTSTIYVI